MKYEKTYYFLKHTFREDKNEMDTEAVEHTFEGTLTQGLKFVLLGIPTLVTAALLATAITLICLYTNLAVIIGSIGVGVVVILSTILVCIQIVDQHFDSIVVSELSTYRANIDTHNRNEIEKCEQWRQNHSLEEFCRHMANKEHALAAICLKKAIIEHKIEVIKSKNL